MSNRAIATGLACIGNATDQVDAIESALDAAERRGRIEALEWVHATLDGKVAMPLVLARELHGELARLRAEEGK